MCGITGIFHFDKNREPDISVIKQMNDKVYYRGPDGEGYYIHKNLALGHRRLSIIDLNTGNQPMLSHDNSIAISFNGEIYNYIELREELKHLNHIFKTNSDTEVIINAYSQWGNDCQNKFNGMWAFALWDDHKQQLLLSRDRIGEKPLHYALFDNTIIFGSEIKSILAYGLPKIINPELLEIYLTLGYIPAPFTFYKNIHKLKAGNCLTVTCEGFKEHQYWSLPEIDENNMNDKTKEIYKTFEELFTDSVKIRMRSDVSYGAFLSGGLDSSSVVAVMSAISSYPVETFTIGFKERLFDERRLATLVANTFSTNHREYIAEPDTFQKSLNDIAYQYDEPFGDSSAIPTGHLSKFARSKVKMVLTGDGGDEVLSGYTIYQGEKFAEKYNKLPQIVKQCLPILLTKFSKPFKDSIRYKLNRIKNVCDTSKMTFENRYLNKMTPWGLPIIKQMCKDQKVYPVEEFLSDFMKNCSYKDTFYKLMFLNLKLSLPDNMLVKIDRMCMAYSLESRTPFLDHRLIEYMTNVDKNVKLRHFTLKMVLRKSIGLQLPKQLLSAPKRGFDVPLREWFKDATFTQQIDNLINNIPHFDKQFIRSLAEMNRNGERDLGEFLWRLFVLEKSMDNK